MKLLLLSADEIRTALPMPAAIDAVRHAYAAIVTDTVAAPPRTGVSMPEHDAVLLMMGARVRDRGLASKLVSVFPRNAAAGRSTIYALVTVFDAETGEPTALLEGATLTALRTGAASGVSTDLLARPDARVGVVIGCGAQGRTQAMAIDAVRDLDEIRLVDARPGAADALAESLVPSIRARLTTATDADCAIEGADVICTATGSTTPVFDGSRVAPGTHISGVGSFRLDMQEVDAMAVRRSRIFIDCLESALDEAGDLVIAERDGATSREHWTEIGNVITGIAPGREHPDEITFFKSVGHAAQDVAAADAAVREARRLGLGRTIEL
jgi:ornithine cyclodeaminase/alanine dehydrogenase-like protein (mu-crystallin family)